MTQEERDKRIEERKNGKHFTAAKVQGDTVDMVLWQQAIQEKINDLRQYADYPEDVLPTLRLFVKIFKFPEGAVPFRRNNTFELWVNQLREIDSICGVYVERAMLKAKEKYDEVDKSRFSVSRPGSIKSLLIPAMVEIKGEIEEQEKIAKEIRSQEETRKKDKQEFASSDDTEDLFAELKKSLKE